MFTAIAPTYDQLNHIISLSFDRRWRRHAIGRLNWERKPAGMYLDLCAGTLDFAAALAGQPRFSGRIVGADFVSQMLRLGRHKARGVAPVAADALQLPFEDAAFDGAMVGWGVRNLIDLDGGLTEAARVLRAGARLVILEMTLPPQRLFRRVFQWYFRTVLPWIGQRISKHPNAYAWLPESTQTFPAPAELARRMTSHGFDGVSYELLMGGVCAVHVGTRR